MKHKILFLAADPLRSDRAAFDLEAREIQVEIERSAHRDRFELVTRWAAQPLDLLRELRRLEPTIVHVSGHGGAPAQASGGDGPEITSATDGTGEPQDGLYFQGKDGRAQLVPAAALAETFGAAGGSVKLVVLSACYSHVQATGLVTHVDAAIGTVGSIRDDAAISFAAGFYGGLADGLSVAAAFRHGCAAMGLYGLPQSERPQLALRSGADASTLWLQDDFRGGLAASSQHAGHALAAATVAARVGGSAVSGNAASMAGSATPMTAQRLVLLCEAEGLQTNRQANWTQIGPAGVVGHGSRDRRIFYVNHRQNIADLRRYSGPADLMARAVESGGDIDNGQIVARIRLDLFSDAEWLRFIRHNIHSASTSAQ